MERRTRRRLGDSREETFLEKLAAKGVACHIAELVGEVTVRSIAEANSYPTVVLVVSTRSVKMLQ
jgi:hypothetical protein